MPDVTIEVDNKRFNEALATIIAEMRKDAPKEVARQAKLLALAIASASPPRIRGLKGLAAGIPKAKADSRMKVIKRMVKPAYSMRVVDVVKMGSQGGRDLDILYGIATTRRKPIFTERNPGAGSGDLQRLVRLAAKNTAGAMTALRQLLKNVPGQTAPRVYQDYNPQSSKHYKKLLDKMGASGLGSISQAERIYLLDTIKDERKKILAEYIPTVGTMKAGWVQAAMAIPSNAGRRPPSWLLNKKVIGGAKVFGQGTVNGIIFHNGKGNAIGFNTRIDYVGRAMRYRSRRMLEGYKGWMRRLLRDSYTKRGLPVPMELKDSSRPDTDATEIDI